jgi:Na+/H+-dicarboxylate symporter
MQVLKYLKNLPVQLVLCLVVSLFIGPYLSKEVVHYIFSASFLIKDILIFVLPFIIFTYIFDALVGMDKNAPILVVTILLMVFLSNCVAVSVSYGVGQVFFPFLSPMGFGNVGEAKELITPLLNLPLPQIISPDKAMMSGIVIGLLAGFFKVKGAHKVAKTLHRGVTLFLQKAFIPVLPIYVTGFVLKLQYEGSLSVLIHNYAQVFVLSLMLIVTYLGILYYVGSGFRFQKFLEAIKNMLPAGVTGFSTMSSAATMPVTIACTEKNLKNPLFADLIIPSTANIHLLGDALAIPLTGLALIWFKTGALPDLATYAVFTVMFSLTKYSCAGVPGGGVIVILPVLEKYLGMNQELISLMTTIYILQDSIFTSSNVLGNGAFAMIVERVCRVFVKKKKAETAE